MNLQDFAAPLEMLHRMRQNARIQAAGIKATRLHIRNQKKLLRALNHHKDDTLKLLIPDAEWKLQELEQKLAELTNAQEDSKLWAEWLDRALRLTKVNEQGVECE